ncbi:MAG: ABC transporter ATP-binding protein [Bacillota bacterium]
MVILKTEGLSKTYGKGDTRVDALKDADIAIEKGEFVAVVGPSGSGKSTLLHLLGGLDKPTVGKVYIDGVDLYSLSEKELSIFRRRKIGFIFQFYNLIPVLSAEENILLPVLLDRKSIDRKYFEELMGILGLLDRKHHFPNQLSGGQQQRVSIGRALAYKPSIVFADEPTGNLDSKNSKEVMELLRLSVQKYNQTLVVITHDMDIASQADRVITIEDGMIVKNVGVR